MATSPARPIRLRIFGEDSVDYYPNELLANFADKKLSLYDADGGSTIDFYSGVAVEVTGNGNAVTSATISGNKVTLTKGSTFLTAHPAVTKSTDGTSTASPAHRGTFTAVDSVTRDSFGHVTKINTKTVTLPSETVLSIETDADASTGNAITAIAVSGHKITLKKESTFLTAHPAVTKSTDGTSTASPAHGGTFTAIDTITRDSFGHVTKINTKTVALPSETALSLGTVSGTGNAVTGINVSGHSITLVKGSTFSLSTHSHNSLIGSTDNRATATTPNDYNGLFKIAGLKQCSAVGSPDSGTYCGIVGFRQWTDSSGGKAHELAFTDSGLSMRMGSTTAWEAWKKIATDKIYTATIGTGWSGSGPYTASVSASGITANDTPIIDINMASVSYANVSSVQEAWGKIYRAVTSANAITFYATEKPTVSIPVQIKVVG